MPQDPCRQPQGKAPGTRDSRQGSRTKLKCFPLDRWWEEKWLPLPPEGAGSHCPPPGHWGQVKSLPSAPGASPHPRLMTVLPKKVFPAPAGLVSGQQVGGGSDGSVEMRAVPVVV